MQVTPFGSVHESPSVQNAKALQLMAIAGVAIKNAITANVMIVVFLIMFNPM